MIPKEIQDLHQYVSEISKESLQRRDYHRNKGEDDKISAEYYSGKCMVSCDIEKRLQEILSDSLAMEAAPKWVKVSEHGNPSVKGFYTIRGLNNQGNPVTHEGKDKMWYTGTTWLVREGCKVTEWLDEVQYPKWIKPSEISDKKTSSLWNGRYDGTPCLVMISGGVISIYDRVQDNWNDKFNENSLLVLSSTPSPSGEGDAVDWERVFDSAQSMHLQEFIEFYKQSNK